MLPRLVLVILAANFVAGQDNLKFGDPGCTGSDREEADRSVFVLCHSSDLRVPLWVGYELTKADLNGPAERPSGFREDKALRSPGAKDKDYKGSGFSRGHMAPAEDFDRSEESIKTTFLLSNIVPQRQGVNGGRWAQLEVAVRKLASQAGHAYVFTGPIFAQTTVDTIGDDEVGIPTHTYKVVLAVDSSGGKKMYAAIMPNADNVTKDVNFYATTVKEVERRTGFDFFSRLDDADEKALEAKKEAFPVQGKKGRPDGFR